MKHLQEAQQLFMALSDHFIDPDLILIQGSCRTEFDGFSFTFDYDEVLSSLFIKSCLCPLSALANPDEALTTILEATYDWGTLMGGAFGLDEEDGFLYFRTRLDFGRTDQPLEKRLLVDVIPRIIGAMDWAVGALGLNNGEKNAKLETKNNSNNI
ncbi:MAG: type III secretion system chaperone [Deltaproteobacteria bacterium]|jgi:hypothetical protein|nr:type III secretion system chaperone [Deltaproteobacteria bacterium]